MTRSAPVCAGWAAVILTAALALAGCGTHAPERAGDGRATLCVSVSLPLSGPDGTAGRGVLIGFELQIPLDGIRVGDERVRVCAIHNSAGSRPRARLEALLGAAIHAAANPHTIAYLGALSGADATALQSALAPAGIPLITPSGPSAAPPSPGAAADTAGGGAPAPAPTALYLLPSAGTQTAAIRAVRAGHSCLSGQHGRVAPCRIVRAPLCTGIAVAPALPVARTTTATVPSATTAGPRSTSATTPAATTSPGATTTAGANTTSASARTRRLATERICVSAGPNLASWHAPAVAYGDSAGRLLLTALEAVARAGGDIADRATVMTQLLHTNLSDSPIGPIRFDSAGAIEADVFSVYTVQANGKLVLSQTFRTH